MIHKRSDFSLLFFCIPKQGTFTGILDCVKKTTKDWISSFLDYKDGISSQNGSACSSPSRVQSFLKSHLVLRLLIAYSKNHITFAMLLGVLGIYSPAEIIPYEPDMYNNSAGKRYGIHCLWEAWIKPSSLGCIMTII